MAQSGQTLMDEANKKLNYKSIFGGNKLDDAQSLFGRAGKEAGNAYYQQGQCLEKMGERDEASSCYLNAGKSLKKEDPKQAVVVLKLAVAILTEKGRFTAAATNQKQIAEIFEQDLIEYENAMDAYDQAGEWYSGEDSNAQASACFLKVAQFAATLEQYDRAITVFEQVAEKSLGNNLTKWSVRDYLFKAGICVLCTTDSVRIANSLEKYKNMDVTFSATREYILLAALVAAIEEQDAEAFTGSLHEFDKMTKLDEWKTTLLLRVKKSIEAGAEDYT